LWDSLAVAKTALHSAVTSAALALSTEVLIHKKDPQYSASP
jgi:chaperonin GroEL (HSP60 family)